VCLAATPTSAHGQLRPAVTASEHLHAWASGLSAEPADGLRTSHAIAAHHTLSVATNQLVSRRELLADGPGDHTVGTGFRTAHSAPGGVAVDEQLALAWPWYREPGVLALALLALAAAIVALVLFVTRHRRLERLVEARTRQLRAELAERQRVEQERAELEQQLHQSQRMEALGRLAGGISHDFNNLLTVICSYADLLAEELSPDDPRHAHAEEIVKAGNRATVLTQQLLQFSRHQAVQRQVVDLNTTLADLLSMLGRLLGEDVHVRFTPATDLWPIRAHRGQLEQVVVNLAVNARDAMPTGGTLAIETANVMLDDSYVRLHVDARPGPHVRLTVTDTGTGMDPAITRRIFEPFFTTKPPGHGSGLGLAMVYGIVRQHDGHITVHTAPGRGTRFEIHLPRTFSEAPRSVDVDRHAGLEGRETILVEDEDAVG